MNRTAKLIVLLFSPFVLGCNDASSADAGQSGQTPSFILPDSVFQTVGFITLEENDDVINVTPKVAIDADGSFLIADGREARIRRYDREGRILWQFGRRGEGPGEFRLPMQALRRPSGQLAVLDFSRGLMNFDEDGTNFLGTSPLPVMPLYTGALLADGSMLLAGLLRGAEDPRALLHAWDFEAEEPTSSFFATPGDSLMRAASRNFGWADFAVRGDTVAAISAFTDTLFLFDNSGAELARIHLPIREFKRMTSYDPTADMADMEQWLDGLHLLVNIHWLEDRTFVVQYQQPRGEENDWHLLRTALDGERLFDIRNTPKLLAVDGRRFFFLDSQTVAANQWIVADLK